MALETRKLSEYLVVQERIEADDMGLKGHLWQDVDLGKAGVQVELPSDNTWYRSALAKVLSKRLPGTVFRVIQFVKNTGRPVISELTLCRHETFSLELGKGETK